MILFPCFVLRAFVVACSTNLYESIDRIEVTKRIIDLGAFDLNRDTADLMSLYFMSAIVQI